MEPADPGRPIATLLTALSIGIASITLTACNDAPSAVTDSSEETVDVSFSDYLSARLDEQEQIGENRRAILQPLIEAISDQTANGGAELLFICTHNSRRSHMSQIWAQAAATHFGVDGVRTHSGGTEATAFHPNAVAALRRAGFAIEKVQDGDNPDYRVAFPGLDRPMTCRSKTFSDPSNPNYGFIAVMTCSSADAECPIVAGSVARVPVTYEDPKAFDGTEREAAAYDERCAQIAREMLFVFSEVDRRAGNG